MASLVAHPVERHREVTAGLLFGKPADRIYRAKYGRVEKHCPIDLRTNARPGLKVADPLLQVEELSDAESADMCRR